MISVVLRHGISLYLEGCKVPTAVVVNIKVLWDMTPLKLVNIYRCFEKAHRLHLQGSPQTARSCDMMATTSNLPDIIPQKA